MQSILSARLLGILGFGILGVVIEFSTNINRLLSFRMGELVVKYMGQYLAEHRTDRASAIFKASILLETVSSIIAYLLLLVLAPLAAVFIVKDTNAAELIKFYALALACQFCHRVVHRFPAGNGPVSQPGLDRVDAITPDRRLDHLCFPGTRQHPNGARGLPGWKGI